MEKLIQPPVMTPQMVDTFDKLAHQDNIMSLSEKLTYMTVLIQCEYKDPQTSQSYSGAGTGFIAHLCIDKDKNICKPVIITNKHVICNATKFSFSFCKADINGRPLNHEIEKITCTNLQDWIMHTESDLCCFPIGNILNSFGRESKKVFYSYIQTDLIPTKDTIENFSTMEDVVMVGYPIGLSDTFNHKPIIRRGVTATHIKYDYQNKKEFLIDMACFPGSSGSPVFILNEGAYVDKNGISLGSRIIFVGILWGGPQYLAGGNISFCSLPNQPKTITSIPTNLGNVIKSSEILEFENKLMELP